MKNKNMQFLRLLLFSSILYSKVIGQSVVELATWVPINTGATSFPTSGAYFDNSILSSTSLNYYGLISSNNGYPNNAWFNHFTSYYVAANCPYLDYSITTTKAVALDRFVIGGLADFSGSIFQLRWSSDNYSTILGYFNYNYGQPSLVSVDLSGKVVPTNTTLTFRIYIYGANNTFSAFTFRSGQYSSSDNTPLAYQSPRSTNVVIWAKNCLPSRGITTTTACDYNLPYTWNGQDYYSSIRDSVILTNASGCDSIDVLDLTVASATQSYKNVKICDGQLPYYYNGYTLRSGGFYGFTFTNAAGCDSVDYLNLTVLKSSSATLNVTACGSYKWHGLTYYTSTNSPTFDTINKVGCDSLTTLHLTISQPTSVTFNASACGSYTWHGTTYYKTTNTPTFLTPSKAGCDSLTTLNLTLFPSPPGVFNNALNFDGVNDVVTLNSNGTSATNFSQKSFTIETWIKLSSTSNSLNTIFSHKDAGINNNGYAFYINTYNKTDGIISFEGVNGSIKSTSSASFDSWNHVAVVYNYSGTGTIGTATIYLNGVQVGSGSVDVRSNSYNAAIGLFPSGQFGFKGGIDEIRIWNKALSASDIRSNMITELSGGESGLIAAYSFNQGLAGGNNAGITQITDKTGNNYTGTLTNFTLNSSTSNFISTSDLGNIVGTTTICQNTTTQLKSSLVGGTWSSSNANVATVNPTTGLVTGVSSGTATITYTLTTSCTNSFSTIVTVKSSSTSITKVSICSGSSYVFNGVTYTNAGTYTLHLTNAAGCDSAATLILSIGTGSNWTGATNTDWNTASNWCNGQVPVSGSDIYIYSLSNNRYPVLSSTTTVGNLNLSAVATLSLNTNTLIINGITNGTGTLLVDSNATLVMNNSGTDTLYFGNNTNDSLLQNLTISGSGTTFLGSGLGITKLLSVYAGTLNTNNHLTLKSFSITQTSLLAPVAGNIIGNATIERFIPQGIKSYRSLSTGGVFNTGSIFNNWQEGGNNSNSYGIFITGKAGTIAGIDPTTGLDISAVGNNTMFNYTNYLTYTPVTNTYNTNIDPYTGYLALVYGNRSLPLIPASVFDSYTNMHSSATIRTTGSLVTGKVTYTTTGVTGNYNSSVTKILAGKDTGTFISNPYACTVSWSSLAKTGLTNSYYYYEPTYLTGGYQSFVSYNPIAGTNSNPTKSNINNYIQPGQGFWIQSNSTVTTNRKLVFTENDKVTNQPLTEIFGTGAAGVNRLPITLWANGENLDGAVAVFNNNFTSSIGDEDSKKMFSGGANLVIKENNTFLSIDGLANPTVNDVISFQLFGLTVGKNYHIRLDANEFTANGLTAFLQDAKTNIQTAIGADSTVYSFTATTASDSRFSIVFKKASPLFISSIHVKAQQKAEDVLVNWTVTEETKIAMYEVQTSNNGKEFTTATTVKANNTGSTSNYNWLDAKAQAGTHHYRIKTTGANGEISFSEIVKVVIDKDKSLIAIYPNPVTSNTVSLQITNLSKGNYQAQFINTLGQTVFTKTIEHAGGNATVTIALNKIANGTYHVQLKDGNGQVYVTELVINK